MFTTYIILKCFIYKCFENSTQLNLFKKELASHIYWGLKNYEKLLGQEIIWFIQYDFV